ncbi:hypothetical protein Scep_005218 [Stephania cephalantha]|uniref:Uncharacterized protein n=1 Tax=Stephania cephalantha TaxID=152367 RepID=A0AAP0KVI1_9MAGN
MAHIKKTKVGKGVTYRGRYIAPEEHKNVKDIDIYLDKDEASQPLPFKMAQDNPNFGSYIPILPKVINVNISGDLKHNKKVIVKGDVIDGNEKDSTVQLFILISKEFDNEDDLKPISESQIDQKEFQISKEVVGYYLVAKYTLITADGKIGVPVLNYFFYITYSETRNVRGKNVNKAIAKLDPGEKYPIQFKGGHGVGPNQQYWSRHIGKVACDPTICSVRKKTWKDVSKVEKNHMWDAVKECFYNSDIETYEDTTIKHMGSLWEKWRSKLNLDYVRLCKSRDEVVRNVPEDVDPHDWEWLVNKLST